VARVLGSRFEFSIMLLADRADAAVLERIAASSQDVAVRTACESPARVLGGLRLLIG
jgi:hypothetical protein